jgi:uncharacterized protein (DUF1778 family)
MAREERITLKIPADNHRQIVKAAAMAGVSIGTFIENSARERAQHILAQHEALALSAQDWDKFVSILDNPPPPNGRLKAAMHKHFR